MQVNGINKAIISVQNVLTQKGQANVRVVAAGQLGNLTNIQPLSAASSDAVRNIGKQLAALIGKKTGLTITDVLADTWGRIAISAAYPGIIERIRKSNGKLGVLDHTVVIALDDEKKAKAYFLRDPANTRIIDKTKTKPDEKTSKKRRKFVFTYPNDERMPLDKILAAATTSNDRLVIRKTGKKSIAIIDPETDETLFEIFRGSYAFDFPHNETPVWSNDGQFFASEKKIAAGRGGAMHIISAKKKKPVFSLENILPRSSLVWRKQSNHLAIGSHGEVFIVDATFLKPKVCLRLGEQHGILDSALSIAWSNNGRFLGINCGQGKLLIFDLEYLFA